MVLRVPTAKATSVGLRKLAEPDAMQKALDVLTGRARVKRTMWSRRAQEYEAKINSGDLIAVSEVVRDLHRAESQAGAVPTASASSTRPRSTGSCASCRTSTGSRDTEATKLIEASLAKSPKRVKPAEAEADAEPEADLQDEAA